MHFSVHLIDKYALHLRNVNTLVMDEILELDNIYLFSTLRGIETFHPLVSVFEFSKMKLIPEARARYGFRAGKYPVKGNVT